MVTSDRSPKRRFRVGSGSGDAELEILELHHVEDISDRGIQSRGVIRGSQRELLFLKLPVFIAVRHCGGVTHDSWHGESDPLDLVMGKSTPDKPTALVA